MAIEHARSLPCEAFLFAYPYPAWISPARPAPGCAGASLVPLLMNIPLRQLLHGSDLRATVDDGGAFLDALGGARSAQALAEWLTSVDAGHALVLRPRCLGTSVILEATKTLVEECWVCTSVPRSSLPRRSVEPSLRRNRSPGPLADFPPVFLHPQHDAFNLRPSKGGMHEVIDNFDWSKTTLGPRSAWPPGTEVALSYVINHPFPTALWWGPELTLIYNDAYLAVAGSKHHSMFAREGAVAFAELWEELGPLTKRVMKGETVYKHDNLLLFARLTRAMLLEETYHSWSYTPVRVEHAPSAAPSTVPRVLGFIHTVFETTSKVLGQRRIECLRHLSTRTALTHTLPEYAAVVMRTLAEYPLDVPFALLYFVDALNNEVRDEPIGAPGSRGGSAVLTLTESIGVPAEHTAGSPTYTVTLPPRTKPQPIPRSFSAAVRAFTPPIEVSPAGPWTWMWPFAEAFAGRRVLTVHGLPPGFEPRGWGDAPRDAAILPIGAPAADEDAVPRAVLVMGMNTRRPYDEEYAEWLEVVRVSLDSTITAVLGRQANIQKAEELAKLDAAKTVFFGNVSHELMTPLTLIRAPLEECLDGLSDGHMREMLVLATRNVTRLTRLVDSLMDFSRLAAQKLQGYFHPMDLGAVTADLASLFRGTVEKSGITYEVDVQDKRQMIYADPDMWEKIVFNLIGNAFKYTMIGRIAVHIGYTDTGAMFSVEDTGVGIKDDDLQNIFTRFYRVDSVSRTQEGVGIGLALVKELVAIHGGSVSVTSRTTDGSSGSKFIVSIPFGKEHLPRKNVVEERHWSYSAQQRHGKYARGAIEEAMQWETSSMRTVSRAATPKDVSEINDPGGADLPMVENSESSMASTGKAAADPSMLFFRKTDVVLLVDDSADMRKYIHAILSPYLTVLEARNGEEALDLLETGLVKVNLVLSDVMMPVMDGWALVKTLRSRKDTNLIPIILLTARTDNDARVEGVLSGPDDYLRKPFTAKELIARVHLHMLLGKRRIELEKVFQERAQQIQLISDLSPVGIFRADSDNRIVYGNLRFYDYTGVTKETADEWRSKIHEEDAAAARQAWDSVLKDRESRSVEFRSSKGTWYLAYLQPLKDGSVLGTITDINARRFYEASEILRSQERELSARKRAEEAEQRREEAESRRHGQELLIDVTSHELRQPVSAILNCSALVKANLLALRDELWSCSSGATTYSPPEHIFETIDLDLDALDSIYQCGLAQERIANDVLSLSRIQLEVLSIIPSDFDLVGEVQTIVRRFHNETKMKKITLSLQPGDSLSKITGMHIRSDRSRFGQVITNLLSNAIKFTALSVSRREIVVRVDVSAHPPANGFAYISDMHPLSVKSPVYVYVAVEDSGAGLQPADLEKLFQRFQQGSNSHEIFGGSGLGLFVSRKICTLMGGEVGVQSAPGQGATFGFFVKAQVVSPIAPSVSTLQKLPVGFVGLAGHHELPVKQPRAYHVLICEDNLINRTVLARQLKKVGCMTTIAVNGLQGVEQIQLLAARDPPEMFDAVLMDQEMPIMDGATAVRKIRAMEVASELPGPNRIFSLTGNARQAQLDSIRKCGVNDVLTKPYKFDELFSRIRR